MKKEYLVVIENTHFWCCLSVIAESEHEAEMLVEEFLYSERWLSVEAEEQQEIDEMGGGDARYRIHKIDEYGEAPVDPKRRERPVIITSSGLVR
jgi:hypothetical protein